MSKFRKIPVEKLIPDPDVQLAFGIEERRVIEMARDWKNPGILDVCPDPDNPGFFLVVDGRHRLLAGRRVGVTMFRCDDHGSMTVAEKAALKLSKDRDRRKVKPIEHFLVECLAGDPVSLDIRRICEEHGFSVRKLSASKPYEGIEAVMTLRRIYAWGPEVLSSALALNGLWRGQPKSNTNYWLSGLGHFVRLDYVNRLSPAGFDRLREVIPGVMIREAVGESQHMQSTQLGAVLAEKLRKRARVRHK